MAQDGVLQGGDAMAATGTGEEVRLLPVCVRLTARAGRRGSGKRFRDLSKGEAGRRAGS